MRQKKIRGHLRRIRRIEQWRQSQLSIDVISILKSSQYHYAKLNLYPWNGFSRITSFIPEPFGKTKKVIQQALSDIYENWKNQLDQLGEDYYLKIWLFDPRFSQSQVVCAVRNKINYYENLFYLSTELPKSKVIFTESLPEKLQSLKWEQRLDEDHYENTSMGETDEYGSIEDYNDSKKWFDKLLQQPHRTTILEHPSSDVLEIYSFRKGVVWIGEAIT